jgi:IS30 family transposase
MKSTGNSHLVFDQRLEIQECLDHGMTFKAIARRVGKAQTTVSREVKRHIAISPANIVREDKDGNRIAGLCPRLLKAPFVCNPCRKRHCACPYDKHFYSAKRAQTEYEKMLSGSREGIPLNSEAFYENDRIISAALLKGQHVYHALQSGRLSVSKSTVYLHIKKGYMSVSPIDLPRMVKFKPRAGKREPYIPKSLKIGRSYADFLNYVAEHNLTSWVEMDTVIGELGGKVILTFDFTFCNFMLGFLLENKTAAAVSEKIREIKRTMAAAGFSFGEVFPVLLTDNGKEFGDIFTVENDIQSNRRETLLFFCDPAMSSQKPHVEKNHTLFRDVVPPGKSFDGFTQETVNLVFSHVNSVMRKSLNGKTPYEMFAFTYGESLAELLGIVKIPPEDVSQSPKLLR